MTAGIYLHLSMQKADEGLPRVIEQGKLRTKTKTAALANGSRGRHGAKKAPLSNTGHTREDGLISARMSS